MNNEITERRLDLKEECMLANEQLKVAEQIVKDRRATPALTVSLEQEIMRVLTLVAQKNWSVEAGTAEMVHIFAIRGKELFPAVVATPRW